MSSYLLIKRLCLALFCCTILTVKAQCAFAQASDNSNDEITDTSNQILADEVDSASKTQAEIDNLFAPFEGQNGDEELEYIKSQVTAELENPSAVLPESEALKAAFEKEFAFLTPPSDNPEDHYPTLTHFSIELAIQNRAGLVENIKKTLDVKDAPAFEGLIAKLKALYLSVDPREQERIIVENKLHLDEKTQIDVDNAILKINNDSEASEEEKDVAKFILRQAVWRQAISHRLLWISHYAKLLDLRVVAATELLNLRYVSQQNVPVPLIKSILKRLFSNCTEFSDCFDLITQLATISDIASDQIIAPEYQMHMLGEVDADSGEITKPGVFDQIKTHDIFLINLLLFRFQSISAYAKISSYTDFDDARNQGKLTSLDLTQANEIRNDIRAIAGPDGVFRKAIKTLRERYELVKDNPNNYFIKAVELQRAFEIAEYYSVKDPSKDFREHLKNAMDQLNAHKAARDATVHNAEKADSEDASSLSSHELSDSDLMVAAISNHMLNVLDGKYLKNLLIDETGLIDGSRFNRLNSFKLEEARTAINRTATQRQLVTLLPQMIVNGLYQTYYSILGLDKYLNLFTSTDRKRFLDIINLYIDKDLLFKQTSFEPASIFLAMVFFSRYELTLPTRSRWYETTVKLGSRLAKYAEEQNAPNAPESGESFNYQLFHKGFIQQQLGQIDSIYKIYNGLVKNFVLNANLTQFQGTSKDYYLESQDEIEQWASANLPGFHSLFHQYLLVQEAEAQLASAYASLKEVKGYQYAYQKVAEREYAPAFDKYINQIITTACYGYWFPATPEGSELSLDQLKVSNEQMIANKAKWQSEYNFPKDAEGNQVVTKTYDLKTFCDNDPENVAMEVRRSIDRERSKNDPKNELELWTQQILIRSGDIALTVGAAHATGKLASIPVKVGRDSAGKMIVRDIGSEALAKGVGNGLTKFFFGFLRGAKFTAYGLKLISKHSVPHLKRKVLVNAGYLSRHFFSSIFNLAVFTGVRKGAGHLLYLAKYYNEELELLPNKWVGLLPGQNGWDYDKDLSVWGNLYHNFGEELVMGAPLFLVLPAATALANRQIYSGSFWGRASKSTKLTQREINLYVNSHGYERLVRTPAGRIEIQKSFGMTAAEQRWYTGVPVAYTATIFFAYPYSERFVSYYALGGKDAPFQGWEVLRDDFVTSVQYAAVFAFYKRYMYDIKAQRAFAEEIKAGGYATPNPNTQKNFYYRILNLKPGKTYTSHEIEAAYRLHSQNPPFGASQRDLINARDTLSDRLQQKMYDLDQAEMR